MSHRRLPLAILTVLATLLAACSAPQGPSMSASETGAAIDEVVQAGTDVSSATAWTDLPTSAFDVVGTAGLPAPTASGTLPRGVYLYDDVTGAWSMTGESDDLELNWLYDSVAHELTIDWDATAPTILVEVSGSVEKEVPVGAEATLLAGGTEVGSLAIGSAWTNNQCGYDEPSSASLSGYLGDNGAKVTLDRLALTIADTAGTDVVTAAVEATAATGSDSLSAYLELTGRGELVRDVSCSIIDFTPESGTVAFGAAVDVDGESRSLDFQTAFDDVVFEPGSFTSVGLNGTLRVDGLLAVSFLGTLDDANSNGVPGDNLQLTFADDESVSLETFLVDHFGWGPLAALKLLAR